MSHQIVVPGVVTSWDRIISKQNSKKEMLKKCFRASLVDEQILIWSRVRKEAICVTEVDVSVRWSDGENEQFSPFSDSDEVEVTDCEECI